MKVNFIKHGTEICYNAKNTNKNHKHLKISSDIKLN